MITRSAPGKLYVAGEYAVTEPGHAAVLVAVDRYVTVCATAAESAATTVRSTLSGGVTLRCNGIDDLTRAPRRAGLFAYVQSALGVAARLRVELGGPPPGCDISITSGLADECGRKLGLGSSGAVTVATIDVLDTMYHLNLTQEQRYRLAMLATTAVDPDASGGDVAAATWGGWIRYHAPDRGRVARLLAEAGVAGALRAPWPGFELQTLPTPTRSALQVGWTGTPASSATLLARFRACDRSALDCRTFLADSDACATRLAAAARRDDSAELAHEICVARYILTKLDRFAHIGIRTPALESLWRAAEYLSIPAKSSGAGGGDCGIALLAADRAHLATELRQRWSRLGIRTLPLRVHPQAEGVPR
ncbi:phosphomevalonate kinase [Nocardia brasiliensis]